MQLRGSGGAVWATWDRAASLGSWTLTKERDGWLVDGSIVDRHAFWITHPLTRLTLTIAGRTWRWTQQSIHVDGDRVRALLTGSPDHL